MDRYRTPRWIVAHVVVLLVAAVFVRLGIWQLDRLDERRTSNAIIADRRAAPAEDLQVLLASVPPDEVEYRPAFVSGTFDVRGEVLVRSRTYLGEAGYHVVTPLVTEPGVAVLVNRGWVPLEVDAAPAVPALPPGGRVEVTGTIRNSQTAPVLGPSDPSDGVLERVFWIDIPRLQVQTEQALVPVSIELAVQQPPQSGGLPIPVIAPEPTEGSHLAYAVQWFAFAIIGLVGYVALLRRSRVGERRSDG